MWQQLKNFLRPESKKYSNCFNEPSYREISNRIHQQNWPKCQSLYLELESDQRTLVLNGIEDNPQLLQRLRRMHDHYEGEAVFMTFFGVALVCEGWQRRSYADAKYVSKQQFREFRAILAEAQSYLERAFITGGDPETLYWLIRTAKGLQDYDMAQDYWRRLQIVQPNHMAGALGMVDVLSPKWYGSQEAVLGFARSLTQSAPLGSLLYALIPAAHIEVWVEAEQAGAKNYFQQSSVIEEIELAWRLSSNYPNFQKTRISQQLHHHFAFAFAASKQAQLANIEFSKLLETPPPFKPWGYVDYKTFQGLKHHYQRGKSSQ